MIFFKFQAQLFKKYSHYKKIGYNSNVLQQTACLVVNPITVGNYAFLFNCICIVLHIRQFSDGCFNLPFPCAGFFFAGLAVLLSLF